MRMGAIKSHGNPIPRGSNSPVPRERREHPRQPVDAHATIHLVKGGSALQGDILNLGLGGCRISCHQKFPVGIYSRVETEFHLGGLLFRLAGVIQAVHTSHHVGIRFLDVSPRMREQIQQLMQEIKETRSAPISIPAESADPQA
jgi:hypothetical protein